MRYSIQRTNQHQPYLVKAVAAAGAALALVVGMTTSAFAATSYVTPSNTMGWTDESVNGGTVSYVDGAPAGYGTASLQLQTDATNQAKATYTQTVTMPLSQVSTLSYYTDQVAASSAGGSASMVLGVDLNNDGVWDTNLVYEPYWQNSGSADAAPVVAGQWQQWDVSSGLFWSSRSYSGALDLTAGAGGPPFYTLAQIEAAYPDAQLMTLGVNVGSYNPNYTILVDGVTLNSTTYDFEKVAPKQAPTNKDQCKQNNWQNLVDGNGNAFKNQGQCVAYVQSNDHSAHH